MHVKSYCSRNWRHDPPWFQETTSSSTFVPQEDCKQFKSHLVSEPLCSRERCPAAQDTDEENHPGTGHRTQIENHWSMDERILGNCQTAAFTWLTSFLNSKPLPTLFPPYKKASLIGNVRWSARVHNALSSQMLAIWIKRPRRFNPCLCSLVPVVTGSTNAGFSSFTYFVSQGCRGS